MSILLSIILDMRRMKMKTKKYPLKLRVTHKREVQYYQTIYDLSKEDYKKLSSSRISEELKKILDQLRSIERTAEAIIDFETFSFTEFEKDYIFNNSLFHQRKSIRQIIFQKLINLTDHCICTGFQSSKKTRRHKGLSK